MISYICIRNCGMGALSYSVLKKSLFRRLRRYAVTMGESGEDGYTISVSTDESLTDDRYRIAFSLHGAVILAANDCAVHAAVGRLLLESFFDGRGMFVPPEAGKIIDFTPAKPIRGIYLAAHFYNFYHVAPLVEVFEVIEDLAMRGCNSILVWFDMHHFTGMDDPAAQELTERLRTAVRYANQIGISGSLSMLGNEAFSSSPEQLRAEWRAVGKYRQEPDDHYHLEICPSKEGGIEEILRERREMLSRFADLDIRYICYWPYDQGGCTCKSCQPWGANGFMKLLPHFQALIKEMLPKCELIVSTWYFDRFIDGEWDAFYPLLRTPLFRDIHYVMAFFFHGKVPECLAKGGIPDGIRFLDFPEISMYSCNPWGGYGASVLTGFLDETNRNSGHLYSGGFPYSEGIFEDANKFIQLGFYSGLYPDAHDALRAYVRSEFCCADEELYQAVLKTETALARTKERDLSQFRCVIQDPSDIEFVYRTFRKYQELLPENITSGRNFRLFLLRAVIDYELMTHEYYPGRSEVCQEAMREVGRIYFADHRTKRCVCPPIGV